MSFKRLDPEDILISAESVTTSAWSNNQPKLTAFYTSSTQNNSTAGQYHLEVYNEDPAASSSAVPQFSIAYGNVSGSGSIPYNSVFPEYTPTATVYGQYRTLIYGDENQNFSFDGDTPNGIVVFNLNRARYKEKLLPGSGSFSITINGVAFRDNSDEVDVETFVDAGRVYNLVKVIDPTVVAGKMYPDIGVLVFEAGSLGIAGALDTSVSANTDDEIPSLVYDNLESFKVRSEETVTSNFVFVRIRNSEFNYSTNPSIADNTGKYRYSTLINNPQAYVTTVGLYNDNNDLVAVAKLSRPLLKDFTKETLIRIKLDY